MDVEGTEKQSEIDSFACSRCKHTYPSSDRVTMPSGADMCALCADEVTDCERDARLGVWMMMPFWAGVPTDDDSGDD